MKQSLNNLCFCLSMQGNKWASMHLFKASIVDVIAVVTPTKAVLILNHLIFLHRK